MELERGPRRHPIRTFVCVVGLVAAFSISVAHHAASAASEVGKTDAGKVSIDLGTREFDKGRFAAAVKHFTTALQAAPQNPDAYLLRGRAYDRLGETVKAIQDFSHYVEARPSDPAGFIARGDARNFAGKHEEALTDYNAAVKLAPASVEAHLGRGLARTGLEQYNLAIKDYHWVLVLQPNNKEVLANLGLTCMLARRPLEAVQYLERALKEETDPKWRQRINEWLETIVQNSRSGRVRPLAPTKKPLW